MPRLFVNVDHVATLREARKTFEPDPLKAAHLAERAGADGITVHLREDRRHIQDHDLMRIREQIHTPLNLEMAAVEEMVQIAIKTRPYQVSLVPEKRQEITTEGGLDVKGQIEHLTQVKKRLEEHQIRFSLFLDPAPDQIDAAKKIGAQSIEINTGQYTEQDNPEDAKIELDKIRKAAIHASVIGLQVFAGHGLTCDNVIPVAEIAQIEEFNIGHSLVARSIYDGFEHSVKNMIQAIQKGALNRL